MDQLSSSEKMAQNRRALGQKEERVGKTVVVAADENEGGIIKSKTGKNRIVGQ